MTIDWVYLAIIAALALYSAAVTRLMVMAQREARHLRERIRIHAVGETKKVSK